MMVERRIYDEKGHAHYITFSCDRNRKLLAQPHPNKIVLGNLHDELVRYHGLCGGYVFMPDHIHIILYFHEQGLLSRFMHGWKRKSSWYLRNYFKEFDIRYLSRFEDATRLWRPKYYDFNIFSKAKFLEKLNYMHHNPVRAGLVENPSDWKWNSARWYKCREPVGVRIEDGHFL